MKVEPEYQTESGTAQPEPQPSHAARHWLLAALAFAVVAAIVVAGILPRIQARNTLARETAEMAIPTVSVVHPQRSAPSQEIVLPGNVQAYIDAPIYARTNGYLKHWYADIGAHVKKGQLLAEIETPEVDQQLRQARADLGTAQANLNLARITAKRYTGLLKSDSVSQQEADNAEGDYAAKKAIVQSAQANVNRLEQMESFSRIYAPFTGVISARNTDIGALIDSGSSGGTRTELFHIVQPDKLRVYVNIPEAYSQAAKPGLTADLTLDEFPGRPFPGKLVRTADAIDPSTRTLLVEIEVNNLTGVLLAGAYAQVHLKLPTPSSSFILPVNALIFRRDGMRVAVVPDGHHAQLKPIIMGRDFGTEVEVVAGLNADDDVVVNPPDSLGSGEEVRITENQTKGLH